MVAIPNSQLLKAMCFILICWMQGWTHAELVPWASSEELADRVSRYHESKSFDKLEELYAQLVQRNGYYYGLRTSELSTFYRTLRDMEVPSSQSIEMTLGSNGYQKTHTLEERYHKFADAWLNEYPKSIAAQVAKADRLLRYARNFPKDRIAVATKAHDLLNRISVIPINDPELYVSLIQAATLARLDEKQVTEYVKNIERINPALRSHFRAKAMYLLPRFQGSEFKLLEYANKALGESPTDLGPTRFCQIACVIKDLGMPEISAPFYSIYPMDYDALKMGFETLLAEALNDPSENKEQAYNLRNQYCWFACNANDKETAKKLFMELGSSVDISAWNSYESLLGWQQWALSNKPFPFKPMHMAVITGDIDQLSLLLKQGNNPQELDQSGHPPLYNAMIFSELGIAKLLLENGAIISTPGTNDYYIFQEAAERNNGAFVKLFIENGAPVDMPRPTPEYRGREWTLLGYCSFMGLCDSVKALLDGGADPMAVQSEIFGTVPLQMAAFRGNIECVKALLDAGAPIQVEAGPLMQPLYKCIEKDYIDTFKYLLERGAAYPDRGSINEYFREAARYGSMQILQFMIQRPDFSPENHNGPKDFSAVRDAAEGNHLEALKLLISVGFDYNHAMSGRDTPLDSAIEYASDECIEYLKSLNAKQNTNPRYNSKPGQITYGG